jgi:hypothetical protein
VAKELKEKEEIERINKEKEQENVNKEKEETEKMNKEKAIEGTKSMP